ncbi:DUF3177 family protein [Synechococcus sp. Nb3U1]|uniref:DUF3177 family protein n=1 Tax=Synechococcus sp. Nb3U1 TaxID=1914529 RepID=UPI001F38C2DC|nr:DUF3177 family protein [Synechococcus sp. Nb3U1]MCF2972735.1 DUF3177 family protein [Synechococcus sp. Nb3U1]
MIPQGWLVDAIWLDYSLAVALTVVLPLSLLVWAFGVGLRPLIQLLIVYWRVSSLLAVTVYLMIAGLPVSFLTGAMARLLILVCVWFWADWSAALQQSRTWAARVFLLWRWSLTGYMGVGILFSGAFVPCAFRGSLSEACRAWLAPPLGFREIFHPNVPVELLGGVGAFGLVAYLLYSVYFVWRLRPGGPLNSISTGAEE